MRLRPHRRTLAGRSPRAIAASKYEGPARTRPARIKRIRRWFRIGALLTIIGVLRFARAMRAHWEPLFLLAGVLLTAGGYFLPFIGMFFPGLLVITVTLLKGNSDQMRGTRSTRPRSLVTVTLPCAALPGTFRASCSRLSSRPAAHR